jgi:hypothetical protein
MQTAEEFLTINGDKDFRLSESGNYVSEMMIDFAKIHVKAALEAASEKATIKDEIAHFQEGSYITHVLAKESILEAYPLTNIK